MPYITREDGERFVIPSYRDSVSVKKASLLKKEIMLLSTNYGEYIALQKKNPTLYEVAFSTDPGYLLGECVWNYFKQPYDMIYCEAIPNTSEAIMVIVKSGSVYLDGSFPVDSIPEELVIFKTQQNNFEIYVYGDVPISQTPSVGKFSFDDSSVKAFTILDAPVFATLPGVKNFKLQLVDTVLKEHGIGVLPVKQIVIAATVVGLSYMAYEYVTSHKKELPAVLVQTVVQANPYQAYLDQLTSPDPYNEMISIANGINILYTIPGWKPTSIEYTPGTTGKLRTLVKSKNVDTDILLSWAYKNNAIVDVLPDGIYVSVIFVTAKRNPPNNIYPIQDTILYLTNNLRYILPGNPMQFTPLADKKVFKQTTVTINFSAISPVVFVMIGDILKNLPLVITKANINTNDQQELSGSLMFTALGS